MKKYKFKATLIEDDERTGFAEGTVFYPKGFYYNKKSIVLVGDVKTDSTTRLSFPVDSVFIEIEEENSCLNSY